MNWFIQMQKDVERETKMLSYLPWPYFDQYECQCSRRTGCSVGTAMMVFLNLFPQSCQNQNTTAQQKLEKGSMIMKLKR